jgi:hypothetical protein
MQWWVIVRLQVAVPPMWQKEARKHSQLTKLIENKVNEGRLEMSKRAIIKQDVKHVAAMILYRHSAEGWWVGPELSIGGRNKAWIKVPFGV